MANFKPAFELVLHHEGGCYTELSSFTFLPKPSDGLDQNDVWFLFKLSCM